MGYRNSLRHGSYDSEASYSPGESSGCEGSVFDVEGSQSTTGTEVTEIENPSLDETACLDDLDDHIQLFGGNTHPPEYYRQAVEAFNDAEYETQGYSKGSLLLLDA